MGWIWSSPGPKAEPENSQTPEAAPKVSSQSSTTPANPPPSSSSNPQLTRDELAESELRSFLQDLEADIHTSSAKYNRVPQPPTPHADPSPTARRRAPSPHTSLEEELLPKEMTCRTAFDAAFYCQSLGGQFNNLYRYGGIKSCSEHWNEFWFCMKTRSTGDEQKVGMIRDYYRRKGLKYKLGPSSEDVWQARDKKLEWGEAFSVPVEEQLVSDEEWNKREQMRRQRRVDGTL